MRHVDAVIFDLDGTLTDSEHWWDEVRRGLAAEEGIPWPQTATTDMMGLSSQEWSRYMSEAVGVSGTPEDIAERTIQGMERHYRDGLPLLPGADEAVRLMASRWPLAICSSSPQRLIETVTREAGWSDLFQVLVSTETVARGKPHPDGLLRTTELLGVEPANCVVIEDAQNGILSALAAGAFTIAVPPHFHPPSDEVLARCDLVLDSLTELSLERLDAALA